MDRQLYNPRFEITSLFVIVHFTFMADWGVSGSVQWRMEEFDARFARATSFSLPTCQGDTLRRLSDPRDLV